MVSNGPQITDPHRTRISLGITNIVVYCACLAILFVIITILVEVPISTMMISQTRKDMGVAVLVGSISFFSIFSFKASRSVVCFLPFFFVLILIFCPIFLLSQEPRNGFNFVRSKSDVLPYCIKSSSNRSFPQVMHNKYVIFQPTNSGTGNKILALVSSYAMALVTGRQLLVDSDSTEFNSIFKKGTIKLLSSVIPPNRTLDDDEYDFLNLVYCRQCSLRLRHPNFAQIASYNLRETFTKKYIVVRSNVYFAPSFFANKYHRDEMCNAFEPKHLFHDLFEKYLLLSDDFQKELNSIQDTIQNKNLIGIQIRLHDRVGFPDKHIGSFFNCANYISSKYNNSLFFLTSDSESLKRQAKLIFGDKLIRIEMISRDFSERGIKDELIDMIILSKCKELILTPFSTFGAVAAGIGNIKPYFVTRNEGYCIKDISSEPKFHYWHAMPQYDIQNIASSDMINQDDSFM